MFCINQSLTYSYLRILYYRNYWFNLITIDIRMERQVRSLVLYPAELRAHAQPTSYIVSQLGQFKDLFSKKIIANIHESGEGIIHIC